MSEPVLTIDELRNNITFTQVRSVHDGKLRIYANISFMTTTVVDENLSGTQYTECFDDLEGDLMDYLSYVGRLIEKDYKQKEPK